MKMFVRDQKLSETATGAGDGGGARKGEGGSGGKRVLPDTMCVCVCVCVCVRARLCVSARETVCALTPNACEHAPRAHRMHASRQTCMRAEPLSTSLCLCVLAGVRFFSYAHAHAPTHKTHSHTAGPQRRRGSGKRGRDTQPLALLQRMKERGWHGRRRRGTEAEEQELAEEQEGGTAPRQLPLRRVAEVCMT